MPLLEIQQIDESTTLGLWKMDESAQQLSEYYPLLHHAYQDACRLFTLEARRRERMSVRALLLEMNGRQPVVIFYNDAGRPLLDDGRIISISHTRGVVAVILSSLHQVGVDVEWRSDRVSRVVGRFLRPDEMTDCLEKQLLLWSAKEAVFKLFSADRLRFEEMRALPFEVADEGVFSMENMRHNIVVSVCYRQTDDFVLTYVSL